MSKSTALNELQKIENSRQILYNIQNEAGLDVNKNDSLLNLSMNTSSLLNANEDYDLWQPDEVWWDIDTLWKNDPLRTVNGGEYKYCSYYLIYNKDDTTTLGSTSYYFGSKFKTSDGGEYTASSDTAKQQFSHTWDKSQDKDWQGQIKTRWVAVYSNNDTLSSYYIPNFNQSILYVIYDGCAENESIANGQINGNNQYGLNDCDNLIAVICKTPIKINDYFIRDNRSLVCVRGTFYSDRTGNVSIFISNGFIRELPTYISDTGAMPLQCYYVQNANSNKFYTYKIDGYIGKSILLNDNIESSITITNCPNLQTIALPQNFNMGSASMSVSLLTLPNLHTLIIPANWSHKIIFGSSSTNTYGLLPKFKNLIVGENFNYSLDLRYHTNHLTYASIMNLINNLKDLTGEASKTLTLGDWHLSKLTDEDILVATNKNWTLA